MLYPGYETSWRKKEACNPEIEISHLGKTKPIIPKHKWHYLGEQMNQSAQTGEEKVAL